MNTTHTSATGWIITYLLCAVFCFAVSIAWHGLARKIVANDGAGNPMVEANRIISLFTGAMGLTLILLSIQVWYVSR